MSRDRTWPACRDRGMYGDALYGGLWFHYQASELRLLHRRAIVYRLFDYCFHSLLQSPSLSGCFCCRLPLSAAACHCLYAFALVSSHARSIAFTRSENENDDRRAWQNPTPPNVDASTAARGATAVSAGHVHRRACARAPLLRKNMYAEYEATRAAYITSFTLSSVAVVRRHINISIGSTNPQPLSQRVQAAAAGTTGLPIRLLDALKNKYGGVEVRSASGKI